MTPTEIENEKKFLIGALKQIIPVKAISPSSGGSGEKERADVIVKLLKEIGVDVFQRYDVTDDQNVVRSNLIVKKGEQPTTLWLIAHTDTVPEGDPHTWTKSPFVATVEGDRVYGRGTSDDGQAVILGLLLLKRLKEEDLKINLGIAFVADEEVGSKYGIQYLLERDIFKLEDLIIVPDSGVSDGMELEIAEKSILWMKFTVIGEQNHASHPDKAVNAARDGMEFILGVDKFLHEKYAAKDEVFNYPYSSFEPTKHEKNVDNINTISGKEVFYMDCRVLPKYDLDNIIDDVSTHISEFEMTHKSTIKLEFIQNEQAPMPTSVDSPVVKLLTKSLEKRGKKPYTTGIGGGTCAAFFRKKGISAVVWSTTIPEAAHRVDEYVDLNHVIMDTETIEDIIYNVEAQHVV